MAFHEIRFPASLSFGALGGRSAAQTLSRWRMVMRNVTRPGPIHGGFMTPVWECGLLTIYNG